MLHRKHRMGWIEPGLILHTRHFRFLKVSRGAYGVGIEGGS